MNLRRFVLLPALLCLAPLALAQDPPAPAPKPEVQTQKPEVKPETRTEGDHPVIHVPLPGDGDDARQQMIKLFGEVEASLREIDRLLSEAAAGQRGAQDAQKPLDASAAGIQKLMKQTEEQGKAVVEGIDKILELAAQQQQQQGQGQGSGQGSGQSGGGKPQNSQDGQSGQQGDQQGKSPLDGQRETTTQRESTPDKPGSEKGQKEQGQQTDQNGMPRGNQKSKDDTKKNGKPPPGGGTEKAAHGPDSRETWGYLPEHARDVFRTQGGGQMPARYREWIDAYYKKLNQKP